MEEENASMILSSSASLNEDVSDSNSSNLKSLARKHRGNGIRTSKFKGVVPQQNGHWGCQIYANHQRIWLGTFKSELEAAMAYDSAAMKLRNGDSRRNIPFNTITVEEPNFQSYYSVEAVLNMIKDGTYQSSFSEFIRTSSRSVESELGFMLKKAPNNRHVTCKPLFQKMLTPSDVGKLNRLVIPKKFAEKFFPRFSESDDEESLDAEKVDDMQLAFYDRYMRLWKFRYCYWKSSQSYVFTRGWNRFVKENQLKPNGTVAFYLYECEGTEEVTQTFYMIDVNHGESRGGLSSLGTDNERLAMEVEVQLQLDQRANEDMKRNVEAMKDERRKGFKLFGVEII